MTAQNVRHDFLASEKKQNKKLFLSDPLAPFFPSLSLTHTNKNLRKIEIKIEFSFACFILPFDSPLSPIIGHVKVEARPPPPTLYSTFFFFAFSR